MPNVTKGMALQADAKRLCCGQQLLGLLRKLLQLLPT
jgi:hypothetical protein